MDLLTRLKVETRTQHQQTETLLYADKLMNGTLSRAEYEHLLLIHYLFHQALETAVAAQSHFFAGYDRDLRRKTPWLVADLHQLELELPPAARPGLFDDWNGYQLLGALYVAEGSALGGRVIVGALRRTPALADVGMSRFFGGYGELTGPLWKAFGTYLTGRADGHDDLVIDAAIEAFNRFQHVAESTANLIPVTSSR